MKWIKASERLPEDRWQGKIRILTDNSLKEYNGFYEADKSRFNCGASIILPRLAEWLDESDGSDREMEEFAEWISQHPDKWKYGPDLGDWYSKYLSENKTTSELVKLFRQSKSNPQP